MAYLDAVIDGDLIVCQPNEQYKFVATEDCYVFFDRQDIYYSRSTTVWFTPLKNSLEEVKEGATLYIDARNITSTHRLTIIDKTYEPPKFQDAVGEIIKVGQGYMLKNNFITDITNSGINSLNLSITEANDDNTDWTFDLGSNTIANGFNLARSDIYKDGTDEQIYSTLFLGSNSKASSFGQTRISTIGSDLLVVDSDVISDTSFGLAYRTDMKVSNSFFSVFDGIIPFMDKSNIFGNLSGTELITYNSSTVPDLQDFKKIDGSKLYFNNQNLERYLSIGDEIIFALGQNILSDFTIANIDNNNKFIEFNKDLSDNILIDNYTLIVTKPTNHNKLLNLFDRNISVNLMSKIKTIGSYFNFVDNSDIKIADSYISVISYSELNVNTSYVSDVSYSNIISKDSKIFLCDNSNINVNESKVISVSDSDIKGKNNTVIGSVAHINGVNNLVSGVDGLVGVMESTLISETDDEYEFKRYIRKSPDYSEKVYLVNYEDNSYLPISHAVKVNLTNDDHILKDKFINHLTIDDIKDLDNDYQPCNYIYSELNEKLHSLVYISGTNNKIETDSYGYCTINGTYNKSYSSITAVNGSFNTVVGSVCDVNGLNNKCYGSINTSIYGFANNVKSDFHKRTLYDVEEIDRGLAKVSLKWLGNKDTLKVFDKLAYIIDNTYPAEHTAIILKIEDDDDYDDRKWFTLSCKASVISTDHTTFYTYMRAYTGDEEFYNNALSVTGYYNTVNNVRDSLVYGYYLSLDNKDYITALGTYNEISNSNDLACLIGIGITDSDRKNGFTINKNGKASLPSCSVSDITETKDIVTKELLDTSKVNINVVEFTATDGQTEFTLENVILTKEQFRVFTNGIRDRVSTYSIEIVDNKDTKVTFDTGKDENDQVEFDIYTIITGV